tara:strand:- start:6663 stop:7706 length:1044 start_codon:yes stop_codon:yes gene_type:complete
MATLTDESPASFYNLDILFKKNLFTFNGKVIPGSLVKTLLSLPGPRAYRYNPGDDPINNRYGREFSMESFAPDTPKIVGNSKTPGENYSEINSNAINYLQHYFSLPANSSNIENIKDLIPSLSFHIAGNMGPFNKFLELTKDNNKLNRIGKTDEKTDGVSDGLKGHLCWLLSTTEGYGVPNDEVSNLIVEKLKSMKPSDIHRTLKDITIDNYFRKVNDMINAEPDTTVDFFLNLDKAYQTLKSETKNPVVQNNIKIDEEMFQSFLQEGTGENLRENSGANLGGSRKKVSKKNNKTKKGGYLKRKRTSRKSHSKKSMKNKKHKKSKKNKKSRKSRKTKKSTKRNNNNN